MRFSSFAMISLLISTPTIVAAQENQPLPATTDGVDPLTAEEALILDGQVYAQRYGVSFEEAMTRLVIMAGTADQIDTIERDLSQELSGIYFDNGPNFQVVVRTTGQRNRPDGRIEARTPLGLARIAAGEIAQKARGRGLQVTTAQLELAGNVLRRANKANVKFTSGAKKSKRSVRAEIEQNFGAVKAALPNLQTLFYDEVSGDVVAEVVGSASSVNVPPDVARRFSVSLQIKGIPNPIQDTTLRGGSQLWYAAVNSAQCTSAFVGWAPKGSASHATVFGIFTAGHCTSAGHGIGYKDATGKMFTLIEDPGLSLDNDSADIRFLKAPVGLGAAAQFFANRNEAARTLTGRRTIASTTGTVSNQGITSTATTGTFVCFYGRRTGPTNGQGCGEVTYNGYSYAGGSGYFVRIKGTFACNQGDSGAPVFAHTTAFGVQNGCVTLSNSPVANELDYTSTDAAYAYGYTLSYGS